MPSLGPQGSPFAFVLEAPPSSSYPPASILSIEQDQYLTLLHSSSGWAPATHIARKASLGQRGPTQVPSPAYVPE